MKLLTHSVEGKVWALTENKIQKVWQGASANNQEGIRFCIGYLHDKGFLSKTRKLTMKQTRDTDAYRAVQRHDDKMPNSQVIYATGSIFNEVMPNCTDSMSLYENVRDRFVMSMCVLALSSPNRMAAEQVTLINQELKDTEVTIDNTVHKVYWLDWCGSKGYKDSRNHILASMSPFVEKSLVYINVACEPARVLCRYYSNPKADLKDIIGNFKVSGLGKSLPEDKPVNLFQLGGLLGFYDNIDTSKIGLKGFPYTADINKKFRWHTTNANRVFGTNFNLNRKWLPYKKDSLHITLSELEKLWLKDFKKSVPSFPERHVGDTGNNVKLEDALFVFTGHIAIKSKGGALAYYMAKSFYAVEGLDLSRIIFTALQPGGIFQKYGFSDDFTIKPHQFRHYLNTKCQESGLPEQLIAMFSGRINVASNAVYDHTPDSNRVAQISHIKEVDSDDINVSVITPQEYEMATGKIAHKMSTGLCTQQLHQSPCTYLNDFQTQCVGCRSSCHPNRDIDAIELLEQDLAVQRSRLEETKQRSSLKTNPLIQKWFIHHSQAVFVLTELITLMKSEKIKEGSLIRFDGDGATFQLIDIKNRTLLGHKVTLPNYQKVLDSIIAPLKSEDEPNSALNHLLLNLGVRK